MRAMARVLVGLCVFQGFVSVTAWACDCISQTPRQLVSQGGAIVVGTVLEVHRTHPARHLGCGGGSDDGAAATVQTVAIHVTEIISGDATLGELSVHPNIDDGVCAWAPVAGERWVLGVYGTELDVGLCGASRPIRGDDDPWVVALRAAAQGDTATPWPASEAARAGGMRP